MRKCIFSIIFASMFLASCGGGGGEGPHSVQLVAIPAGYTAGDMNDNGTVSLTKPAGAVDGLATLDSTGTLKLIQIANPGSTNYLDSVINNNGYVGPLNYVPRVVWGFNRNLEYVQRSVEEEGLRFKLSVLSISSGTVYYDANDFGGGVYLRLLDLN